MFFEFDAKGKILVCADEKIKPNMIEIAPPEGFEADSMGRWIMKDGVLTADENYVEPETEPNPFERLDKLEAALNALMGGIADA